MSHEIEKAALVRTTLGGPLYIGYVENTRKDGEGKRGGTWKVSWREGQVLVQGWKEAIDWLDKAVRDHQMLAQAVILAGSRGTPWVLASYLAAAEAAEAGSIEGVWDEWADSARDMWQEKEYAVALDVADEQVRKVENATN